MVYTISTIKGFDRIGGRRGSKNMTECWDEQDKTLTELTKILNVNRNTLINNYEDLIIIKKLKE
jgi:hypothetical protein